MVASPCLSPVRVFNATLGRYLSVPCGHCDACLVNKGRNRTDRVNDVFLKYRYRFLITLTYAPKFLPLARYDESLDAFVSDKDCDYNGVVYSVSTSDILRWKNKDFVQNCLKTYGGIPVLSRKDVINFKKRLRKHLFQKLGFYEKNFIFACGEYGPTGFRPHYHLLFGTNEEIARDSIRECVSKAWSLCHQDSNGTTFESFGASTCDESFDRGGADYCAQYLNCTTHLPFVLSKSVFKPFCTPLRSIERAYSAKEFYTELPVKVSKRRVKTGELVTTIASYRDYSFVFPKYSGFLRVPCYVRSELFEFSKRFDCFQSCRDAARNCLDILRTWLNLCQFLKDNSPLTYLDTVLPVSIDVLNQLYGVFSEDCEDKLTLFFQVNRRIAKVLKEVSVSPIKYFERDELYRSRLSLAQLSNFYEKIYELQHDSIHPLTSQQLLSFYIHTDVRDCEQSVLNEYYEQFGTTSTDFSRVPVQSDYAAKCHQILLDTTKTKKRNDEFRCKGLRRKAWLPIINNKLTKFL